MTQQLAGFRKSSHSDWIWEKGPLSHKIYYEI